MLGLANAAMARLVLTASGESYEGDRKNGIYHGRGTCVFPNGDKYEGDWMEGKMHGNGTYLVSSADAQSSN